MATIKILSASKPPRSVEVDAHVFGQWGAHRALGPGWSVTHVPTGMRVPTREMTEAEARRLASLLHGRVPPFGEVTTSRAIPPEASQVVRAVLGELELGRTEGVA